MLEDYIKSKNNIKLIRSFAFDKSQKLWPDKKSVVIHAIDVHLLDIVDQIAEKYAAWALTPENLATVNIEIWKSLRPKIEQSLQGAYIEPEERHKALSLERDFISKFTEEASDTRQSERSFQFLEHQYLDSWK